MAVDLLLGTASDPVLIGRALNGTWLEDNRLQKVGLSVLKRNKFTCIACGFKSRPSRQDPSGKMIPVDLSSQKLLASKEEGASCLCPYCVSALSINWSVDNPDSRSETSTAPGLLIYCPWITQNKISLIANHACAIAATQDQGCSSLVGAAVRDTDSAMTSLNQDLAALVPIYRGNDGDFARALALLPNEFYEKRREIISAVRWWPNLQRWKEHGEYFFHAAYRSLASEAEGS